MRKRELEQKIKEMEKAIKWLALSITTGKPGEVPQSIQELLTSD